VCPERLLSGSQYSAFWHSFHVFSKCWMSHAEMSCIHHWGRRECNVQKRSVAPLQELFKIAGKATNGPVSQPGYLLGLSLMCLLIEQMSLIHFTEG
jgi:hypothetical protein